MRLKKLSLLLALTLLVSVSALPVQLYKSLLFLKRSIDRDLIVSAQREALQTLRCIISNLEYRFYKAYGMEIEDKRTVYGECTYRLVPREDEPSVCLMHDWIYLPTA